MNQKITSLFSQLRVVYPFLFKLWLVGGLFLGIVVLVSFLHEVPVRTISRDPAALLDAPFYLGLLSNLGALFWAAAASICFFTYMSLRWQNPGSPPNSFLLHSGLLTSLLLFDDFFMLHEEVFPFYLGISEILVFGTYGLLVLLYLYRYRFTIMQTDYMILFAAFALLGSSVLVDLMPEYFYGKYLVEDGFKFMGIITWLFYFTRTSLAVQVPQEALQSPQPNPAVQHEGARQISKVHII